MIELFGAERIMVNSAGDWGHSDPLAVPELIFEMRRRGHDEALIRKVVYENPLSFFSQCERFEYSPREAVRRGFRGLSDDPSRLELTADGRARRLAPPPGRRAGPARSPGCSVPRQTGLEPV